MPHRRAANDYIVHQTNEYTQTLLSLNSSTEMHEVINKINSLATQAVSIVNRARTPEQLTLPHAAGDDRAISPGVPTR